ncbi:hypothetical protein Q1695_005510 [Nippostrongylus brasiliensis]|nr:hypothetical protein Q1695_005510 [Nippostrongylus brasiliensis]
MINALDATSSTPSVSLLLTVRASQLPDLDVLTKSDPMCVAYQFVGRLTGNGRWQEIGRTETLKNTLNPEWATQIRVEYLFEEKQTMRFEVYDIDSKSAQLSAHDFVGRIECELAEIVSNRPFTKALSGGKRKRGGELTIWSDEVDEGSKENVEFHWSAKKLDKKDLFGKSDPFLNIYRVNDDGSRMLAHRTDVIKKDLNPQWRPFEVNVKMLCGGDYARQFLIECFDYDWDGGHDLIGVCHVNLDQLLSHQVKALPLINEKKRLKKGDKYKDSGTLEFNGIRIIKQHSFLDYISGGTQLDFAVAVDFTASNGAVHKPTSLHCINPTQPNQYEIAIRAIIDICQHYNNSKLFDAFGFGAIVPPDTCVSPVFSLNGDANPAVVGLPGVMEAYRYTLNRVRLYGPTNFAPVINEVAKKAAKLGNDGSRYQVLLIITDGAISDMAATKSAIIGASSLPLSIIIVGVGNDEFENMNELDSDDRMLSHAGRTAQRDIVQVRIEGNDEFENMNELDSDDRMLSHAGRTAQRDIVQFVPLRNFLHSNCVGAESERVMGLLAKEVLAEVPLQLTSYMKKRNIVPRPADNPFPKDPEAVFQPSLPSATMFAAAPAVPAPPQAPVHPSVQPQVYPPQPQIPHYQPQSNPAVANYPYGAMLPPQPAPPMPGYPQYSPYPPMYQQQLQQHYPYPTYPPTVSPMQHAILQQSAAPSAPMAPPVDLDDIQPTMAGMKL